MTDEELVRANWDWVQVRLAKPFEGIAKGKWMARLPMLPFSHHGFNTEAEAWAAAASFTRERLEQVRQLERELLIQHNLRDMYARDTKACINWTCSILGRGLEGAWATCAYTVGRTILRLESALADLKRDMKDAQ
jgi:hypothetical protein